MSITAISDVIVPEIFVPAAQLATEQKSRMIASGAVVRDPILDAQLAGGGLTFNEPSFKDLADDVENTSSDDEDDQYTGGSNNSAPKKTGMLTEVQVRLSRNQSWSSADLAADLIAKDPMDSIANRVGAYWARRSQAMFVATMTGVFADNDAAASGSDTHSQGDLSLDVSGASYSAGVTDFSAGAFLDAAVTMGDSQEDLGMIMVHSIVFNRMQKNNLIEVVEDSISKVRIPTFLGRIVIVDDGLPNAAGVFQSWMFGAGALRLGMGSPKVPVETKRNPDSGNGGGSEVLYNRVEWCLHPVGHRYIGTPGAGGPTNAATANNLANADSWQRCYTERKQIKIARLITREF